MKKEDYLDSQGVTRLLKITPFALLKLIKQGEIHMIWMAFAKSRVMR